MAFLSDNEWLEFYNILIISIEVKKSFIIRDEAYCLLEFDII
jgi:hypothetical protein